MVYKLRIWTNENTLKNKLKTHGNKYNIIFDICSCQCKFTCRCKKENKIPPCKISFIKDQRSSRILVIKSFRKK